MRSLRIAPLLLAALSACAPSERTGSRTAARSADETPPAAGRAPAPDSSGPLRRSHGAFAFPDSSGTLLLALESVPEPASVRTAICRDAGRRPAGFLRAQERAASDNGRQTGRNFANLPGQVFRVSGGRVPAEETCYLSADSALAAGAAPAAPGPLADCRPEWTARVATARGRAVVRCRPMAAGPGGLVLFAAVFQTLDTNALASIVALDGDRLRFADFPATYGGPDESVWRVDDGGEFRPEDFRVLFVSRVRGVLVLGLTWAGSEGEDAYLLAADSGESFRTVSQAYRYWAPQ